MTLDELRASLQADLRTLKNMDIIDHSYIAGMCEGIRHSIDVLDNQKPSQPTATAPAEVVDPPSLRHRSTCTRANCWQVASSRAFLQSYLSKIENMVVPSASYVAGTCNGLRHAIDVLGGQRPGRSTDDPPRHRE